MRRRHIQIHGHRREPVSADWREITTLAQNDARLISIHNYSDDEHRATLATPQHSLWIRLFVIWLENFPQNMDSQTHIRVGWLVLSDLSSSIILLLCSSLCREGVSGQRRCARVGTYLSVIRLRSWENRNHNRNNHRLATALIHSHLKVRWDKCTHRRRHGASAIVQLRLFFINSSNVYHCSVFPM